MSVVWVLIPFNKSAKPFIYILPFQSSGFLAPHAMPSKISDRYYRVSLSVRAYSLATSKLRASRNCKSSSGLRAEHLSDQQRRNVCKSCNLLTQCPPVAHSSLRIGGSCNLTGVTYYTSGCLRCQTRGCNVATLQVPHYLSGSPGLPLVEPWRLLALESGATFLTF